MRLVKIARGKKTLIEEGTRKQLNNRLKQLRKSTRRGAGRNGYPVQYLIEESNE